MKRTLFTLLLSLAVMTVFAQKEKYLGVAIFNTQSDLPFGKFSGMFSEIFHPGAEVTWGTNFRIKKKHDWFWDARVAYFFHRFVQHGIPVYANIGYRYKFNKRFAADLALGAGYMHSIPATGKLKLNENGDYENNKGIGRMQANACFGMGAGYLLNPQNVKPVKLFIVYQQRLQMPFVKSYVPILPYNSFMIGFSKSIAGKK